MITGGPVLLIDCICIDNHEQDRPRLIFLCNSLTRIHCPIQFILNVVFFCAIAPLMSTFYAPRYNVAENTYRPASTAIKARIVCLSDALYPSNLRVRSEFLFNPSIFHPDSL
jgi:hypothetical protein